MTYLTADDSQQDNLIADDILWQLDCIDEYHDNLTADNSPHDILNVDRLCKDTLTEHSVDSSF